MSTSQMKGKHSNNGKSYRLSLVCIVFGNIVFLSTQTSQVEAWGWKGLYYQLPMSLKGTGQGGLTVGKKAFSILLTFLLN